MASRLINKSGRMGIRMPTVIVAVRFAKVPKQRLKLSARNTRKGNRLPRVYPA